MEDDLSQTPNRPKSGFVDKNTSEKPNFDIGGEYIPFEEIKEPK